MYDSVFQPLQGSGTTFPRPNQLYAKEICCAACGKMVVTPDTDWFSDPCPYHFLRNVWLPDAYLYSQSCEIHRLGPNKIISIDWFPYMNCNSVKSLTFLHVAFIFLFIIITLLESCSQNDTSLAWRGVSRGPAVLMMRSTTLHLRRLLKYPHICEPLH